MTLEQILELARQARRSPDARRVLHDALLERYGDVYEYAFEQAQRRADSFGEPRVFVVDIDVLRSGLPPQHAFWDWSIMTVRGTARQDREVMIGIVRPR